MSSGGQLGFQPSCAGSALPCLRGQGAGGAADPLLRAFWPPGMDPEAAQLEKQHVHDVYASIAPYFSDLQSKAWPRVRQFLQEQKPGSLIADIGCGTGKYLKVNSQSYIIFLQNKEESEQ